MSQPAPFSNTIASLPRWRLHSAVLIVALILSTGGIAAQAPPRVTSPQQQLGHQIGDDYYLPDYTQLTDYWTTLDRESDRMQVMSIGKTAEGRDQLMAIITAPANFRKLDRYREIVGKLARAEGLTDEEARSLAREGKAVVWIDGGLHATEVLGANQLMEIVYQLVSRNDEETLRILRDTIVLCVQANPDGMELVADWYMKDQDEKKRNSSNIPRLYQKYIGHDNNRDFYMMNQPESTNMNRVLYREWYPQILYNHHQTGPTGTIMFSPPFRDPFNYLFDPIVVNELDQVGAAMHARFDAEGKPGVTTRSGSNYSTWWNGGLRTMAYFHNIVGLLTESIGNPTPTEVPFVPDRLVAKGDYPFPIQPQVWHFRQSIDYSVTANYAVLDFAQRYRETLLYNQYLMGRNAIRKGSTDSWTDYPMRVAKAKEQIAKAEGSAGGGDPRLSAGGRVTPVPSKYFELLRKPELRDPRGYIIPSDQADVLTVTKFVNALIKGGIVVHRATSPFTAAGKTYPAGSYVVKTAQAFRAHILDMFEPQDHPNDFAYPGGPPVPPYDSAGWTLAYQMGVRFDRVLDGFDVQSLQVVPDVVKVSAGRVVDTPGATGYVISHHVNDAVIAVNRLLKAGEDVFFVRDRQWHSADGYGVIYVASKPTTRPILERAAAELGLTFTAVSDRPAGGTLRLRPVSIGLWDQYGGSAPSGWVRWMLEQYEFPFELVFPQALDAGNLNAKFDVLLFPEGIPESDAAGDSRQPTAEQVPAEWRDKLGRVSVARTVPQLKAFVEGGGSIVGFGKAAVVGQLLGLPVGNHLVEMSNGSLRKLPNDKIYIPGSVLRVAVDPKNPLAYGMDTQVDVFFDEDPVLRLEPNAALEGVKPVAWFDSAEPLRSGWAWGQHYLQGGAAGVEASLGKGKVMLFGPEITFRAQPHGTFKFLFNSIYYAGSTSMDGSGRTTTGGALEF